MKYAEFKKYLTTEPVNKGKPYADSTAKERAGFCATIERVFGKNLDLVALDPTERVNLLGKVKTMPISHINAYVSALLMYYDFVDMYYIKPVSLVPLSKHFYTKSTDVLPQKYIDIIGDLEGEYECIMGFGRDLLELDFYHLLKNSDIRRIERIPVIFSSEIKKSTYTLDDDQIAEMILALIREKGQNLTKKEILSILKNRTIKDIITGEFIGGKEPYIIIYYNAIKAKNRDELIANVASVLAHEYMHYMEYVYCSVKNVQSYQNENLSEAMADFFSVLYSVKCHKPESITVAKKRYKLWEERFYSCWPYAQALLFYRVFGLVMGFTDEYDKYVRHGSKKKLKDVFEKSFNADVAYDILNNL